MIYALTVESVQFEISKSSFNLSLITLNSTEIRFFFDEFLIGRNAYWISIFVSYVTSKSNAGAL